MISIWGNSPVCIGGWDKSYLWVFGEKLKEIAALDSSTCKKKASNLNSVLSVSGDFLLKFNYDFASKIMCL